MTVGLTAEDKRAAAELARLAKSGSLTDEQALELENYRRAGRIFELLKSQARLVLRKASQKLE